MGSKVHCYPSSINGGEISNYSTLETETLTGVTVSRTSNDGDDTDGEFDDVTKISILRDPSIEVIKDWSWDDVFQNGRVDRGEIVTFSVSITNTGNVSVENFVFTETFTDLRDTQPPDLSGELSPLTTKSPEIILPGETIVYTRL
ncbi:MAG: hypothetical protein CM15mP83_6900 [Flavobacteriaceae bacterium]|nr:MAG: hypothetical protein CM15mP83_6900 [Flavobacteriaceae bacterium]